METVQENNPGIIKIIIVGVKDPFKTKWMQAGGMFECFKIIGKFMEVEMTLKKEPTLEEKKAIINLYKNSSNNEYEIFATYFIGEPDTAFVDKSVRVVSNGSNFCIAKDFYKQTLDPNYIE